MNGYEKKFIRIEDQNIITWKIDQSAEIPALKFNIRFPYNTRHAIDIFVRDNKANIKETLKSAQNKLNEKQKYSVEKIRMDNRITNVVRKIVS